MDIYIIYSNIITSIKTIELINLPGSSVPGKDRQQQKCRESNIKFYKAIAFIYAWTWLISFEGEIIKF